MADRTLLVVRHSKADQGHGVVDQDRPLSARGRRDAPWVGAWIAAHAPPVDVVLCSSARRTQQTWRLAAPALDPAPALDVQDELYLASVPQLLDRVRAVPESVRTLVVVGHEPTQSGLTLELADGSMAPAASAALSGGFVTSGIALLTCRTRWADLAPGTAHLRAFVAPHATAGN